MIASLPLAASAAMIDIGDKLVITGGIDTAEAKIGYVNNGMGGTANQYAYAGMLSVNIKNTTQNSTIFTIGTFCMDVGVEWESGKAYTAKSFVAPLGVNPAWSSIEAIQNAAFIYNQYFAPFGKNLSADQNAGIQLAIWEVLYDTGASGTVSANFAGGNFRATGFGGALTTAASYITSLQAARDNNTFIVYTGTWLKADKNDSQSLIFTPVPEPTTILAGALLLLPFAASTLRRVRKA